MKYWWFILDFVGTFIPDSWSICAILVGPTFCISLLAIISNINMCYATSDWTRAYQVFVLILIFPTLRTMILNIFVILMIDFVSLHHTGLVGGGGVTLCFCNHLGGGVEVLFLMPLGGFRFRSSFPPKYNQPPQLILNDPSLRTGRTV